MQNPRPRFTLSLFPILLLCVGLQAQTTAPRSGDVTVKLIEGLDSANAQPGTAAHAVVTKSTNPAILRNTPALVQLGIDPSSGGFGVQLVQLSVGGQQVKTASANAVLGSGLFGKVTNGINGLSAKANKQQISLTGPHVLLPPNTVVQFTLIPSVDNASGPVGQQARTPEPPNVWQSAPVPYGQPQAGDSAVTLAIVAANGQKHGRAHLIVSCTNKTFLSVYFTIAQSLIGYTVNDFSTAAGDDKMLGRLTIGDGQETSLSLSGNAGEDSPVKLNFGGPKNGFPDSFFSADAAGKSIKLTIMPPDEKGTATIANFTTPSDPAPMLAVSSTCMAGQAQEAAEAKAKILVSCPAKPEKSLVDAKVRVMPGGKLVGAEGFDEGFGATWDLTSQPLKAGHRAVLDCIYGPPGAVGGSEPKVVPIANRVSIPLPANAVSCQMGGDPVTVTCSRK